MMATMKSKLNISRSVRGVIVFAVIVALAAIATAPSSGDTLHLRDGSRLNGKVFSMVNDTLSFKAFGNIIKIPRTSILLIDFTDSLRSVADLTPSAPQTSAAVDSGMGTFALVFKDRKLSSKIKVYKMKDYEGHVEANTIIQSLSVDGKIVFSVADTTTDKVVYKGRDRELKNNIKLEDVEIQIPTGVYDFEIRIRNVGAVDYYDKFVGDPVDLVISVDNVRIHPDRTKRIQLGLKGSKMGMGKKSLYRVDSDG
jgi:hypothetical protein